MEKYKTFLFLLISMILLNTIIVFANEVNSDIRIKEEHELSLSRSHNNFRFLRSGLTLQLLEESINYNFKKIDQQFLEMSNKVERIDELLQEFNELDKTLFANMENYVDSNFKEFDVRLPSGINPKELDEILKDTELNGLGKYYVDAEKLYNVNALFLVSLSAVESNWGRSGFAKNRNNLFGFKAYTHAPENAAYFETKEDSILTVADHLNKNYLTKGGDYHKGHTIVSMNKFYAADPKWHLKIGSVMSMLYERIENGDN